MFSKTIFSLVLIATMSSSFASTLRNLNQTELNAINLLVACPAELTEVLKEGEWVGSGKYWDSRNQNKGMNFVFAKRDGFVGTEYVKTLKVSMLKVNNPAADAPGFEYKCELVKE